MIDSAQNAMRQIPVGKWKYFSADYWRIIRARKLAARGDIRALKVSPNDPVVLQRLGLHSAALVPADVDPESREYQILALAEKGEITRCIAALARRKNLRFVTLERIAIAIGKSEPQTALALLATRHGLEQAALALTVGNTAVARCPSVEEAPTPDRHLINAAFSARRGDHQAARHQVNSVFRHFGLAPPLLEEGNDPISLHSFDAFPAQPSAEEAAVPLVSVIMPILNAEKTLETAIHSILKQSYREIELLCYDDGSTDGSARIVSRLALADQRLRLMRGPHTLGAAGARNQLIQHAQGQWIMLADADDWSHPDRLIRQLKATEKCGASLASHVRINTAGEPMSPHVFPLLRRTPATLLCRRSLFERLGPFDEVAFGSDSEFVARIDACCGRAATARLSDLLLIAHWGGASISHNPQNGLASNSGRLARESYRAHYTDLHLKNLC